MESLVELLDRQVDFLLRQTESAAFLIQIEPFLEALRSEPRLAAYLDDVLQELVGVIEAMEEADAALSADLLTLRRDLVGLWPGADDSNLKPPSESESGEARRQARLDYRRSLAYFDEWAAREPEPFNADGKGGIAKTLLGILQNKDHAYLSERAAAAARTADAQPDLEGEAQTPTRDDQKEPGPDRLDAWRGRLGNVQRRYDYAVRLLRLRARTSAGLALVKLEAVPDDLNPPARFHDAEEEGTESATDLSSQGYSLFKLAWQQGLDGADVAVIDERVDDLRDAIERLREDLHRRIGATRSRLALVDRFKVRCEWHDRERMLAVADDDRLPGGPDSRLTRECARYLFDAGLSPLTEPLAQGLQPDLLDPLASFYVEARQYASASARGDIVAGVREVLDTVGRLRAGPYAVDEAFCVVFRRDGPYYDLPAVIQTETYRLHLVLVDLGPTTDAGRRERTPPVRIGADEFIARAPDTAV